MHHYPGMPAQTSVPHYVVPPGVPHAYGPQPPVLTAGLEIPPPPPPVSMSMQAAYHQYASHPYPPSQAASYTLPIGHQYPPGYAAPPPYASPSAPPALYPDVRYHPAHMVPPPMSPNLYPTAPATPVLVYANGQPSPNPLVSQQGYYSSMLNSPLPSPHHVTSPSRPYSLSSQTSPLRPSPLPSPIGQSNGLKSPLGIQTIRSPGSATSMKSPSAFQPMRSPHKSPLQAPSPLPPLMSSMTSPPMLRSPDRSPGRGGTPCCAKSPISAGVSPPDNASSSSSASASKANGPLKSLEKMLTHPDSVQSVPKLELGARDQVDCKLDVLKNLNSQRADACPRRSSSQSESEKPTTSRIDQDDTDFDPSTVNRKKRGRPVGSRSRVKKPGESDSPVKRKRAKKLEAKVNESPLKEKKTDKLTRIGPRIHIEGVRKTPNVCTVVNSSQHSDDSHKKSGSHKEKESLPVDRLENVKLTDAPWVCCFCGWGSTHGILGDLFGPFTIEGFRPPTRRDASPKKSRKRRDSRCQESDDEESRSKLVSGSDTTPGEAWAHEECLTWAEGVYMVGYKIQGLDEASRIARQTQCSSCKVYGATIGCLHKGCQQKYHYLCAVNKDCLLNEENFSLVCHKHKDKKIKMVGSFSQR